MDRNESCRVGDRVATSVDIWFSQHRLPDIPAHTPGIVIEAEDKLGYCKVRLDYPVTVGHNDLNDIWILKEHIEAVKNTESV